MRRRLGIGIATVALLVAGMAVFGSGTPASRVVGREVPAFLAAGLRTALGALVLLPLMAVRRRSRGQPALPRMSRVDLAVLGGIALFGMFAFGVLMVYGMREVTGAVGSVVMAATPAVTAVGAFLFMRERLDGWRLAGIALAVAGVLAVNLFGGLGGEGGGVLWLGTLLVFGAVCGEAAYTLLGKRLMEDLSALDVAALAAALGAALFAPFAIWQALAFDWSAPDAGEWTALGWWGVGTLALGSVLWYSGVHRVAGSVAAGFMGVMPVSALLVSYAVLGESFHPMHLVGMGLVLAGLAAMVVSHARREMPAARSTARDERASRRLSGAPPGRRGHT